MGMLAQDVVLSVNCRNERRYDNREAQDQEMPFQFPEISEDKGCEFSHARILY